MLCTIPGQVPVSRVHMRLCSLPLCPELTRNRIPQTVDVGRLLAISGNEPWSHSHDHWLVGISRMYEAPFTLCYHVGTVTRVTTVKVLECSRQFLCSRCQHVFTVNSDLEQYNIIPKQQRSVLHTNHQMM